MAEPFKPYIQISRRRLYRCLRDLKQGAVVFLYMITQMDTAGLVRPDDASDKAIMAATGLSAATVEQHLDSLEAVGLIQRCELDGAAGYRVDRELVRYVEPASPSKKIFLDAPLVVVDSLLGDESQHSLSESETTTNNTPPESLHPQGHGETDAPRAGALDSRLNALGRSNDLFAHVTRETLSAFVAAYGAERVVWAARWFCFEQLRGRATSGGWLRRCLEQGWSEPKGFSAARDGWMTDEEREAYWSQAEAWPECE